MVNCLVGTGSCGEAGGCPDPEGSVMGHSIAPFIQITMEGSDTSITVGNRSSPQIDNTASIKSFQYNFSSGYRCRLVVYDEQGGNFSQFMRDIVGCWSDLKPGAVVMKAVYGWTKSGCDGDPSAELSQPAFFLLNNVVADYNQGRIQFEIEGTDLLVKALEGRDNRIIGTDITPRPTLKEAIKILWTEPPNPIITDIEFKKVGSGQSPPQDIGFDPLVGKDGPRGTWPASGRDKIGITNSWLRGYTSENKRGWRAITSQTQAGESKLIIMEDPQPIGNTKPQDRCIRTYFVNGGNCSRVIEFNPKIKWDFQANAQRRTGDTLERQSSKVAKAEGDKDAPEVAKKSDGAGVQRQSVESVNSREAYPQGEQSQEVKNSAAKNDIANYFYHDPIEADLVVQGDPHIAHPIDVFGKFLKIVVINPYHISKTGLGCGDWLLKPDVCNAVLSNNNWMVRSVDHFLQEGLFTTTWRVMLAQPGTVLNPGSPLGNSGSFVKGCKPTLPDVPLFL